MKITKTLLRLLLLKMLTICVLSANADTSDNFIQKGDQAFEAALYKQALKYYQHATPNDSEKPAHYVKIARCFQRLGINHSALSVLKEVLKPDPNNVEALLLKGEVKEAQQEYEQALAIYQQVEQLDPTNQATYYNQANVLRKMGRDDEATQVSALINNE